MKQILEAYSTIDEEAHITGVALIPRISRNNNLYTKKELARFNNVKVPLNWEHDPTKVIGHVTFHYNKELETVYYDGMITDEASADLARNKTLFTSIEADPRNMKEICNGPDDCFHMPYGLVPVGMALTETPGVPETSVKVIENYIRECPIDRELELKYSGDSKRNRTLNQDIRLRQAPKNAIEQTGNPNDDCVSRWVSKLADEDPKMSSNQRVAMAISKCSRGEALDYIVSEFNKMQEALTCPNCGEVK